MADSGNISSGFSETGQLQAYEYCSMFLARSIRDKTPLEYIISELSKRKSETGKRNEGIYRDRILSDAFDYSEREMKRMTHAEENALDDVMRILNSQT